MSDAVIINNPFEPTIEDLQAKINEAAAIHRKDVINYMKTSKLIDKRVPMFLAEVPNALCIDGKNPDLSPRNWATVGSLINGSFTYAYIAEVAREYIGDEHALKFSKYCELLDDISSAVSHLKDEIVNLINSQARTIAENIINGEDDEAADDLTETVYNKISSEIIGKEW